ncbi:MAG: alpha/beta hydrolase-fold protein [Actinomycetota bacterium]|nr:alpha/beta hydrolase-fold protein [Actinomycetota bacterium]
MHAFDHIGILGPGFLTFLAGTFVAIMATVVLFGGRHHWWRWSGTLLSLIVALCFAAASVNNHYAYLPNLGSLWGWRAADQANWTAVRSRLAGSVDARRRLGAGGAVVEMVIPGTVSHFHARPATIYLPPAYFLHPQPALPVVELLHGTPGSPRDWTRSAGADVTSDRYAWRHGGRAPILVSPDINGSFTADSECTNGTDGNVETYLTVDVPRWVRMHLASGQRARQWAIGGLSEGGTCAMDIALRHPAEFPTFLDFAGDLRITHTGGAIRLFRGKAAQRLVAVSSYDPVSLLEHFPRPGRLSAWFEVGARDRGSAPAMKYLYRLAVQRGVHAHLVLTPDGHHSFRVWRRSFADSLAWLARRLRLDQPHRGARPFVAPVLAARRKVVGTTPAMAALRKG